MICHRCNLPYKTPGRVEGCYAIHDGQCACWNSYPSREPLTEQCACGVVALVGAHVCADKDATQQCATCRHWTGAAGASRGDCVIGARTYPWCNDVCARWTSKANTQPATPPAFDMRAAWGQYMPGVGKKP